MEDGDWIIEFSIKVTHKPNNLNTVSNHIHIFVVTQLWHIISTNPGSISLTIGYYLCICVQGGVTLCHLKAREPFCCVDR